MQLLALILAVVPALCSAVAVGDPQDLQARAPAKTIYTTVSRRYTKLATAKPTTVTRYLQATSTKMVTTTLSLTTTVSVRQAKRAYAHDSKTTAKPTKKIKVSKSKSTKKPEKAKKSNVRARAIVTKTKYVTQTTVQTSTPTVTVTQTKQGVAYSTTTQTLVFTKSILIPLSTSSSAISSSTIASSSTSSSAAAQPTNITPAQSPEVADPAIFAKNVLAQHNAFRADFGVPALKWNTTLATFAQNWVSQCGYYHSVEKYGNSAPLYGENIAAAWSNSASYLSTINSTSPITWWGHDEFPLYSYNPRTSRGDEATGHFQNMVWKSYTDLGCAVAYCPNGLTNDKNVSITTDPSLYWSCDFGLNPATTTSWDVSYNIPMNITAA